MENSLMYKLSWRLALVRETILKTRTMVRSGTLSFAEVFSIVIPRSVGRIVTPNKKTYERKLKNMLRRVMGYSISATNSGYNDLVLCRIEHVDFLLPRKVYQTLWIGKSIPNNIRNEELDNFRGKNWVRIVYDEIFVRQIYQHKHVKISPGDVVIDAGACEGFFTLYALQRGACVHAFEANPEMADALEKTLALHGFENKSTVHRVGLSDEASEHVLIVNPVDLGATTFSDSERKLNEIQKKHGKRIQVQTETLDNLYERGVIERVDFIKADIEGYERRMLRGAEKVIRKFKPKLAICYYHLPDDLETLIRIIKGYNRNYKLAINDEVLFAWDEDR